MEFYLAKEVEVTLSNDTSPNSRQMSSPREVPVKLEPCNGMVDNNWNIHAGRLASILGLDQDELTGHRKSSINFDISGSVHPCNRVHTKSIIIIGCYTINDNSFFHRVFSAFATKVPGEPEPVCEAAFRIKVRLPGAQPGCSVESDDYQIAGITSANTKCYGTILQVSAESTNILTEWTGGKKEFTGVFSLILILNNAAINRLFVRNGFSSASSTLREMFEHGMGADTVFLPDGVGAMPVKCHRAVLATRSPVFKAMFQRGMTEPEPANKLTKINDMSEPEMRAFIKYLYTWDVEECLGNCRMTLKMFKAGTFYQVIDLCTAMYEIIMMKPDKWFSADVAVDLLTVADLFSRASISSSISNVNTPRNEPGTFDVTHLKDLKERAVRVLKWYSRIKPMDLLNSERYKSLNAQNPQISMELHDCLTWNLDGLKCKRRRRIQIF